MDGIVKLRKKMPSRREDFIAQLLVSDIEECVPWPFAIRKSNGYPAHCTNSSGIKKNWDAHRYVCLLYHGEPEGDKEAAHRCGNRLCVNPKHIHWDDRRGNMKDAIKHGTLKGGGRYRRKIFPKDIEEMVASAESHIVLASKYGVDPAYIGRLRRQAGWSRLQFDL